MAHAKKNKDKQRDRKQQHVDKCPECGDRLIETPRGMFCPWCRKVMK